VVLAVFAELFELVEILLPIPVELVEPGDPEVFKSPVLIVFFLSMDVLVGDVIDTGLFDGGDVILSPLPVAAIPVAAPVLDVFVLIELSVEPVAPANLWARLPLVFMGCDPFTIFVLGIEFLVKLESPVEANTLEPWIVLDLLFCVGEVLLLKNGLPIPKLLVFKVVEWGS